MPGTGGVVAATGGAGAGGAAGVGGAGGAGGAGGGGGQRTGGAGGAGGGLAAPRILSIDFIGAFPPATPASGGAGGRGGAGGNAGSAGATVIPLISLPTMASAEIAGVKRGSHWNGAPGLAGSRAALTLSGGGATSATVTWNSPPSATGRGTWWNGYADAPGDVRMMNGYLDPHSPDMPNLPATITVNSLPATITAGGYDVYVYVTGDVPSGTRTYGYTIGMATVMVNQVGPSPTTFSGYMLAPPGGAGNYVVFRNLTAPSFTLLATPGGGGRAPVNGIQIVSPTGS